MMHVGEEVSSTSEHGRKLLLCDQVATLASNTGQPEDHSKLTETYQLDGDSSTGGPSNGELAVIEPSSPTKCRAAEEEPEGRLCMIPSTCDDVGDLAVSSSESNSAELSVSGLNLIESSNFGEPTSLTTSPTGTTKISFSKRSKTTDSPPFPTAKEKEKAAINDMGALKSSHTDLGREPAKSELLKSDSTTEGRVLRLRPTTKADPPKTAKQADSRKSSVANCADRSSPKTSKIQKRKLDEVSSEEMVLGSAVIQYKGYKKLNSSQDPTKKLAITFNPFNPAFRRDCARSQLPTLCPDFDPTSLQPEYAQYLGLQPLVKFRCSNCGMSSFQTMSALNAHKADCSRTCDPVSEPAGFVDPEHHEPKSANIKFTRKVFLCSACGTYYELWNLFLHMREAHRRYICLECLGMSSSPEKLSDHLKQKHGVMSSAFNDNEKLPTVLPQAFYLMCINCDKIYSETDKFTSHKCPGKRVPDADMDNITTRVATSPVSTVEPVQSPTGSCGRASVRKARELTKKSIKYNLLGKKTEVVEEVNRVTVVSGESSKTVAAPCPAESAGISGTMDVSDTMIEGSLVEAAQPNQPVSDEAGKPELGESVEPELGESVEPVFNSLTLLEPDGEPAWPEQLSAAAAPIEEIPPQILADLLQEPTPVVDRASFDITAPAGEPPSDQLATDVVVSSPPPSPSLTLKISTKKIQRKSGGGKRKRSLTMTRYRKSKRSVIASSYVNQTPNPPISTLPATEQMESEGSNLAPDCSSAPSLPSISTSAALNQPQGPSSMLGHPRNIFKSRQTTSADPDESDDSQNLSLIVDESADNSDDDSSRPNSGVALVNEQHKPFNEEIAVNNNRKTTEEVALAGDEVQPMALALDDKIDLVPIQAVVKECVRTSCLSCNYCRHAHKIAVNGTHLALHLLSEHRYRPTKNETPEDTVAKLRNSLLELEPMFFNSETYDNTDPSVHVPHNVDSTFDCFQCNFACSTHKDLFAHKRKSHSKPLLLCVMCKTNFFSYSEMLCHLCPGHYKAEIMFHNVHINFRCCFCELDSIPSAFRLMVHLRKKHHTCDICLESCSDQQKLSTHLWKHKVNHLCYRCGISYASKPDITKHLFWKHGHESVLCKKCLQKKWPHVYHFCIPPTSFICEECSASFSKAVALKVHKRIHTQEFPYLCGVCEKQFVSKKSLARHEERHRKYELGQNGDGGENLDDAEQKDEIINVTDIVDNKQSPREERPLQQNDAELTKEKVHRKHRKERKDRVVDPYDLPPLNLSSESDSSDEKETPTMSDLGNRDEELVERVQVDEGVACDAPAMSPPERKACDVPPLTEGEVAPPTEPPAHNEAVILNQADKTEETNIGQDKSSAIELSGHYPVEGVWENFYKTNPTNQNLPYPLCAMKSEVAYSIIMGDHDYCIPPISVSHKENSQSVSELESGLLDDKMEEININVDEVAGNEEKKKIKSTKKKIKLNENSSSSSDSSTDTDSSSCTCGTNCSCSSSSSNSSSSSSSESDSSVGENKLKVERRLRRKEKRSKQSKSTELATPASSNMPLATEVIAEERRVEAVSWVPVDPPARESELETDESSTDEEFYDKQPGQIANQIIAEKRNQLIISAAPLNNGSPRSPLAADRVSPPAQPVQPSVPIPKKLKAKEKKQRKSSLKVKEVVGRPVTTAVPPLHIERCSPPPSPAPSQYRSILSTKLSYPLPNDTLPYTPSPPRSANLMTASDSDKSRSSKRRRIPNKFYGYSSGDDEDKPPGKVRRNELTPTAPLRFQQPILPSPTPRIQLTVPKQIIRKPIYHKAQKTTKITIVPPPLPPPPALPVEKPPSPKLAREQPPEPPQELLHPLPPERQRQFPPSAPPHQSSTKPDKAVYCYCRCPYDEVSEMIACDDESCPIEWFHFECVGILVPPRGQWYCPGCRKARGLPT